MSQEALNRIVENMIADDVSEAEIASVIQQHNSDEAVYKAKKESQELKRKYNFHDEDEDEKKKINIESEKPDLTEEMIKSIEEKDSKDIPVDPIDYPDVGDDDYVWEPDKSAIDEVTIVANRDRKGETILTSDFETEETTNEVVKDIKDPNDEIDNIFVDLDLDKTEEIEETKLGDDPIVYNPDIKIKDLGKDEKEEIEIAEDKDTTTRNYLNDANRETQIYLYTPIIAEHMNSLSDPGITLWKRNIGDGWVVYSNLSAAGSHAAGEIGGASEPIIRTTSNPDDAWENANGLGQYWSFTSENAADAFINSKKDKWNLIPNNELYPDNARNILKGSIVSNDKIWKFKSSTGPSLELNLFSGKGLTLKEHKIYGPDFENKKNEILTYTKSTLGFEKQSLKPNRYPDTFKDLSTTEIDYILNGIHFVKFSINGIIENADTKTVFSLLNNSLYKNELTNIKEIIKEAINNPTSENANLVKNAVENITGNLNYRYDLTWELSQQQNSLTDREMIKVSTDNWETNFRIPSWDGEQYISPNATRKDGYKIPQTYLNNKLGVFKLHTGIDVNQKVSSSDYYITTRQFNYWKQPLTNIGVVDPALLVLWDKTSLDNLINREGDGWWLVEGTYIYRGMDMQHILDDNGQKGIQHVLDVLGSVLRRESSIYEGLYEQYENLKKIIHKENLYSIIGENGENIIVSATEVLEDLAELMDFFGTENSPNQETVKFKKEIENKTAKFVKLEKSKAVEKAWNKYQKKLLEISFKYNLELERFKRGEPLRDINGDIIRDENNNPIFPREADGGIDLVLKKEKELEALANAEENIAWVEFTNNPDVKSSNELLNYLNSDEVVNFKKAYSNNAIRINSITNSKLFKDLDKLSNLRTIVNDQFEIVNSISEQTTKEYRILENHNEEVAESWRSNLGILAPILRTITHGAVNLIGSVNDFVASGGPLSLVFDDFFASTNTLNPFTSNRNFWTGEITHKNWVDFHYSEDMFYHQYTKEHGHQVFGQYIGSETKYEKNSNAFDNITTDDDNGWIGKDGRTYWTRFDKNMNIIGHYTIIKGDATTWGADRYEDVLSEKAEELGLDKQAKELIKNNEMVIDYSNASLRRSMDIGVSEAIKVVGIAYLTQGWGLFSYFRIPLGITKVGVAPAISMYYGIEQYNDLYFEYRYFNEKATHEQANEYAFWGGIITGVAASISPESKWMFGGMSNTLKTELKMLIKSSGGNLSRIQIAGLILRHSTGRVLFEEVQELTDFLLQKLKDNVHDSVMRAEIEAGDLKSMYQTATFNETMEIIFVTGISTIFVSGGGAVIQRNKLGSNENFVRALLIELKAGNINQMHKWINDAELSGKLNAEQAKEARDLIKASAEWFNNINKGEFNEKTDQEQMVAVQLYVNKKMIELDISREGLTEDLKKKQELNNKSIEAFENGEFEVMGLINIPLLKSMKSVRAQLDFSKVRGVDKKKVTSDKQKRDLINQLLKRQSEGGKLTKNQKDLLDSYNTKLKKATVEIDKKLDEEIDEWLKNKGKWDGHTIRDRNKIRAEILRRKFHLNEPESKDQKRKEDHIAEVEKLTPDELKVWKDNPLQTIDKSLLNADGTLTAEGQEIYYNFCKTRNQREMFYNAIRIIETAKMNGIDLKVNLHFTDKSYLSVEGTHRTDGIKVGKDIIHIRANGKHASEVAVSSKVLHEGFHVFLDLLEATPGGKEFVENLRNILYDHIVTDESLEFIVQFAEQYRADAELDNPRRAGESSSEYRARIDGIVKNEAIVEFLSRATSDHKGDDWVDISAMNKASILISFKKYWNYMMPSTKWKFNVNDIDFDEAMSYANHLINGVKKGSVDLNLTGEEDVEGISKSLQNIKGEKINKLNAEGMFENLLEIENLFKEIISDAADKLRISKDGNPYIISELQGYNEDAFVSQMMTFAEDYIWGSKAFDVDKTYTTDINGNPDLFAYVNSILTLKIPGVVEKTLAQAPESKPHDPTDIAMEGVVDEITVTGIIDQNEDLKKEEEDLNTTPIDDNIKVKTETQTDDKTNEEIIVEKGLDVEVLNPFGEPVIFRSQVTKVINTILSTKIPSYELKGGKNDRSTPFLRFIRKELGSDLMFETQQIMGKTNEEFITFLENNTELLVSQLSITYLAKNIPEVVEKYVKGVGWTTDWKGKTIERWGAKDGPAWVGVTSGPIKMRVSKDIDYSKIDLTKIYTRNGKQIQYKKEGLSRALAQQIGLEVFHKQISIGHHLNEKIEDLTYLKNKKDKNGRYELNKVERDKLQEQIDVHKKAINEKAPIYLKFKENYEYLENRTLQGNFVNVLRRDIELGNVKQSKIRKLDPIKLNDLWTELPNIGRDIAKINKRNPESVRRVVEKYLKDKFTKGEIGVISKEIFDIVSMYQKFTKEGKDMVSLEKFIYGEVENRQTSITMAEHLGLINSDGKTTKLSQEFINIDNLIVQRAIPLDFANDMIESGMSKTEAVTLLLKYYKAQYTSASKISGGGIFDVINGILTPIIGGEIGQQRYQSFKNVNDFVENVLNEIDGVKVEMSGKRIKSVTIDDVDIPLSTFSAFTQTKANLRKQGTEASKIDAEGAQDAVKLLLTYVKGQIELGYLTKTDWGLLMMSLKSNMNTILRRAAHYKFDHGGKLNKNDELEHSLPVENLVHILTDYYLNPETTITDQDMENLWNDYTSAIITYDMNKLINSVGLQKSMPANWKIGDPLWLRYYNEATMMQDGLHTIIDLETNEVIGEGYVKLSETMQEDFKQADFEKKIQIAKSKQSTESKGISVFDLDDALIKSKSEIIVIESDGNTYKLTPAEFAEKGDELRALEENGEITLDFSEFSKLIDVIKTEYFGELEKKYEKFGGENIYLLTARPHAAWDAINEYLKSQGFDINIITLEDGSDQAKVDWFVNWLAEGYNDFYYLDDHYGYLEKVEELLLQFDVKSELVQAKTQSSKQMDTRTSVMFNTILEEKFAIPKEKVVSDIEAQLTQKNGRFSLFPPSAYDFKDFIYTFLPKGQEGENAMKFFEDYLINPYNKGVQDQNKANLELRKDYKKLVKNLPKINKSLKDKIGNSYFTYDNAVRVYLWDKFGFDIPGIDPGDVEFLVATVERDSDLQAFADGLGIISRQEGYVKPGENWVVETVASDIMKISKQLNRKDYLSEFIDNKNIIFSKENMNKLRQQFGPKYIEALEDILWRMETGNSRRLNESRIERAWNNWVNNSVGAIMFLNMRSAVLQTISGFNFLNWKNNTPLAAAKAFANQPQYWSDFSTLWNSDYIQSRMSGEGRTLHTNEIAKALEGKENKAKALLEYLLKIGFTPTRLADAFAICSGGAAFYRNQINYYLKQTNPDTNENYTLEQAERLAYDEFYATADESQQSADPSKISQQQAGGLGRILLAFKNTPMQYTRIIRRSIIDLYTKRGDVKTNLSKILYYGVVQNFLFTTLQQAMWAIDWDDEEMTQEAMDGMGQSMVDNLLNGLGLTGTIIVTVKNGIIEYKDQEQKGWNADHTYTILEFANLSPTIGSKLRKIYSSIKTVQLNQEAIDDMGLNIGNPAFDAWANLISAFTNVPADRVVRKINNIILASESESEVWQKAMLLLGWNAWDVGLETEARQIQTELKEEKKKTKEELKEEQKQKNLQKLMNDEVVPLEVEEEKKGKKGPWYCPHVKKNKTRCGVEVEKAGDFCTYHEEAPQREDGKKSQCSFVKTKGGRCGNQTAAESGLCPIHD